MRASLFLQVMWRRNIHNFIIARDHKGIRNVKLEQQKPYKTLLELHHMGPWRGGMHAGS